MCKARGRATVGVFKGLRVALCACRTEPAQGQPARRGGWGLDTALKTLGGPVWRIEAGGGTRLSRVLGGRWGACRGSGGQGKGQAVPFTLSLGTSARDGRTWRMLPEELGWGLEELGGQVQGCHPPVPPVMVSLGDMASITGGGLSSTEPSSYTCTGPRRWIQGLREHTFNGSALPWR